MKMINLTPHPITIRFEDGEELTIPPSGQTLRLEEDVLPCREVLIDGKRVEIAEKIFKIPSLPEREEGTLYIVSLPVLQALQIAGIFDDDFVAPDTGPTAIRNENGQIVAVRRMVKLHGTLGR